MSDGDKRLAQHVSLFKGASAGQLDSLAGKFTKTAVTRRRVALQMIRRSASLLI